MKTLWICLILVVTLPASFANELKGHASPYLAMHGDDPVNWKEWNTATLEQARKENKLIFVSVGYYACHWCHVMHRESFKNPEIAKKLNDNYLSVKVDRELNPVLDKRLIEFVAATIGHAGWPLSVWITPEGYPLVGATYVPPQAFSAALTDLASKWDKNQKVLSAEAREQNQIIAFTQTTQEVMGKRKHLAENRDALIADIMLQADTLEGGFGQPTKFPSTAQLQALLELNAIDKNTEIDDFIQLTLDMMMRKGLHDELAGGFFRYTVDPSWHTPHFEKMLYTNALLPIIYLQAAERYQNISYRKTALQTLNFVIDEMQGNQGAYIASLSAVDTQNIEGGYYLWNRDELKKLLSTAELHLIDIAWKFDRADDLEAGKLPFMHNSVVDTASTLGLTPEQFELALAKTATKLLRHRRASRQTPKDDKLLTGWNALLLAAFAKAHGEDRRIDAHGAKLAAFLQSRWQQDKLLRTAEGQQQGTLYDYAATAWGLISWGKAAADADALKTGVAIAKAAWREFRTDQHWIESQQDLLPQGSTQIHLADDALPSAETLLFRAASLSDDASLNRQTEELLKHSSKVVESNPYSYASLISFAVSRQPIPAASRQSP